ncbi:hypothetical protein J3R83DRAFT_5487 [Lanmaoa asiatica]|nr:hypothetical protein J3R83DRAFT_5487 [Lanmaoa asiatica]
MVCATIKTRIFRRFSLTSRAKFIGFSPSRDSSLLVRVDPSLAVQRLYGSLADYPSIMCPKDNQLGPVLDPSEDPRKTTGFLFSARWLGVVRSHPLDELLGGGIDSVFSDMWNMVDAMEILPPIWTLPTLKTNLLVVLKPENIFFGVRATGLVIFAPCCALWMGHLPSSLFPFPSANVMFNAAAFCVLSRVSLFLGIFERVAPFSPPTSISPNITFLTFCFCTIAIPEASHRLQLDPSLTFMGYYQDALFPLLKEGYSTPFNSLRQLMHLVVAHTYDSVKLPDMHWNQQRDTVSIKGFPLKISLVPETVRSLCVKVESPLEGLLLGKLLIELQTLH